MTDQKTSSDKKGLSVKERLYARYKAKGFSNGKSAELAGYKAGTSADKQAVDTGQIGSAVTAEHYRGKVANLYTERLEVSETNKESSDEIMLRISNLLGNDEEPKDKSLH